MATSKKAAKKKVPAKKGSQDLVITIGGVTKVISEKSMDKVIKEMEYSKGAKTAALAGENKSDLCLVFRDYGAAARFVLTIIPGIGTKLKKIKKGIAILLDAIETNCSTDLDGIGEDEEEA